jgi:hypothetical protein
MRSDSKVPKLVTVLAVLLLIYVSACQWRLLLSECVLVCCCENVGA